MYLIKSIPRLNFIIHTPQFPKQGLYPKTAVPQNITS